MHNSDQAPDRAINTPLPPTSLRKYGIGYLRIGQSPELLEIIRNWRDNIASPFLVHLRVTRGSCNEEHWIRIEK